jgi:hypothetical protein
VSVVRFGRVEDGNSNGSSVFELLGVCFANSVVGMRDLTPASQNGSPENPFPLRASVLGEGVWQREWLCGSPVAWSLLRKTLSSEWGFSPHAPNAEPQAIFGHLGLCIGRGGFEPPLTGPEPVVLPLDDLPEFEEDLTQSVVGRQDPFADPLCGSLQ